MRAARPMLRVGWTALAGTMLFAACRDDGVAQEGSRSTTALPSASTIGAAPSPGCSRLPDLRARLPKLRDEGKLDRSARVLRRMAELCPERVLEDWSVRIDVLAELGRTEEIESLVQALGAQAGSGDAVGQAAGHARRALDGLRPSARDAASARRHARELYSKATLEPADAKARELFLAAAAELPMAGPSLYQAGRAAKRLGNAVEARRLFDRALTATERSTGAPARLVAPPRRSGLRDVQAGAAGRLVLATTDGGTMVLDALLGWQPRFDHDVGDAVAALSSDGTWVVMGRGRSLWSCSLVEGRCASTRAEGEVRRVALSTNGEIAVAVVGDGKVASYDTASLEPRGSWSGSHPKVTALALTEDATHVLVGLADGAVLRVAREKGAVEREVARLDGPIVALA